MSGCSEHCRVAASPYPAYKVTRRPGKRSATGLLFEDDGESWGYQNGNALWVEWEMVCDGATINLKVNARGDYRPAWKALKVSLPAGEKRTLRVNGAEGSEWVV